MNLQNNLYTIISQTKTDVEADYQIQLNPECFIYKAHFPGQPITPGVCVVQIAKELTENFLNTPVLMLGAKSVKFLSVMVPGGEKISCNLIVKKQEDNTVSVQAEAKSDNAIYTKMSLLFKVIS